MKSTTAMGVHIALQWSGLQYEVKRLHSGQQRNATYLSMNPMAVVPTLVMDNGQVLTEALAILCYIDELAPDRFCSNETELERARLRQALSFLTSEIYPNFRLFRSPAFVHPDHEEHATLQAMACNRIERLTSLLEGRFQGPYLFGPKVSVADPYMYILLSWIEETRINLKSFSGLHRFKNMMDADRTIQSIIASYETAESCNS